MNFYGLSRLVDSDFAGTLRFEEIDVAARAKCSGNVCGQGGAGI